MGRVQGVIVSRILGSKLQKLENNADVLLQHWFQGNIKSFQDVVLKMPYSLAHNTQRTKRRIEQVLQLGLNYESHANLHFSINTDDAYCTWLGNRQNEADDKTLWSQ